MKHGLWPFQQPYKIKLRWMLSYREGVCFTGSRQQRVGVRGSGSVAGACDGHAHPVKRKQL